MTENRYAKFYTISSFAPQDEIHKVKCPQCKHLNYIKPGIKSPIAFHVKLKCWYCKRVTFDVTFLPYHQELKK